MTVSERKLETFIEEYLSKFQQLISVFSEEYRQRVFPRILIKPHMIIGTISRRHGLAIEFAEEADQWSLEIHKVNQRIENAVLPQKSTKNVAFLVGKSRNVAIGRMAVYTKEFFEKYVEKTEGTTLKLEPPLEAFTLVSVGGDVIFYEIQFGAILNAKPFIKTIKGCLWIFGSNLKRHFTTERTRKRAVEDFNQYLSFTTLGIRKFPEREDLLRPIKTLSEKIKEFQRLISKNKLKESELQKFFQDNPDFLKFGTRYEEIFPRIRLKRIGDEDLIPDFLLKRVTNGYCDILDIKLRKKKVLRGKAERRRFTAEVYEAIAQVHEYKDYFDDPRHKEWIKKEYGLKVYKPNIMVLIGLGRNIDDEDFIKIRDIQPLVEVITYKDVLNRMTRLEKILKSHFDKLQKALRMVL